MVLGLSLDAGRLLPSMILATLPCGVPPCTRAAARLHSPRCAIERPRTRLLPLHHCPASGCGYIPAAPSLVGSIVYVL